MSYLRRTRAGEFFIDESHSLEEVISAAEKGEAEDFFLPVDRLFAEHPHLELSAKQEKLLRNGVRYSTREAEGTYRLYSEKGEFLALARVEQGLMISIKTFFEVK